MRIISNHTRFFINASFRKYAYLFFTFCLCTLFFYPVLFSNKTFFFRDIHRWFYPMKYYLSLSYKNGFFPFWIPNYYCGSPFLSDIQTGFFYPLSLVFLLFPFPFSFNIYIVIHFFLGFIFFYLFLRSLKFSKKTAIILSISYCYGGYMLSSVNTLNNLSTLIWLPAILWSYNQSQLKHKNSWYFLTILFIAMAILGGEPQLFILMAFALLLFWLVYHLDLHAKFRKQSYNLLILFILFGSALCITAVQVGTTYIDYQESVRLGGLSYKEASRFSLDVNMLKHFIWPISFDSQFISTRYPLEKYYQGFQGIPWLLTIYPGFIIGPLALFGLVFNYSRKFLFWLIVFIFSLTLSLGSVTPLHYIFFKFLPIFRYPEKFIFLTSFCLLIMAAYGLEHLFIYSGKIKLRPGLIFLLLSVTITADLYIHHKSLNPLCDPDFYDYHHPSLQPIMNDNDLFRVYYDTGTQSPSDMKTSILGHHLKWQMMLVPNLGILHKLSHANGVPALELKYQYLITEILNKPWPQRIRFLRMANVKYIITSTRLNRIPELSGKIEKINELIYKIKDFLPRAWVVRDLKDIKDTTIDDLFIRDLDYSSVSLTSGDIKRRFDNLHHQDVEKIHYNKNSGLEIEVNLKSPGILVITESFYPGWRVFINGHEKKCLALNYVFQGVELEKGLNKIEFTYRPKYFGLFLSISCISLIFYLIAWFLFIEKIKNSR